MTRKTLTRSAAHLGLSALIALSLTPSALAQDAGLTLQQQDRIDVQAGLKLTVPFGPERRNLRQDKPTLQFALSTTRSQTSPDWNVRRVQRHDILALGFDTEFHPRLSLSGQDATALFFPSVLHADEDGETEIQNPVPDDTATRVGYGIIIVGGAALLAASFAFAEDIDNLNDFD